MDNNQYVVTVQARDDGSNTASLDVTVTVTDVNEEPEVAGSVSLTFTENQATDWVLAAYTASDPENPSAVITQWSLSGTDAGDFTINSDGELTLRNVPDHERPADSNRDNVYEVTVRASDGSLYGYLPVTVTVTDVNEAPVVTGDASPSVVENSSSIVSTYTATGQLLTKDILVVERQETYEVTVGVHDGFDADYNPDHNPDASVDVTITVTGGTFGTVTSSGGGSSGGGGGGSSGGGGGGGPPANSAPVFRDADGAEITETTRMITEDAVPGAEIGEPVAATGADEDALTYTLSGDDAASFAIDASTGQLTTVTTLDHETKSVYTVVVTATDPSGATVDVPVIITVTDVEFDCSSGNAVPEAADNPGLVADCEALLEARARLVGTAALNWSEDTPITEWDGVRLGGTPQRVVGCTFHAATWTELYRPAWAVCRR